MLDQRCTSFFPQANSLGIKNVLFQIVKLIKQLPTWCQSKWNMLKSDCVSLVFKVANFFTVRLSEHNHGCCFLWGNPDWFVFTQDHKLCVRVFLSLWLTRPHDMTVHTREGRCPEGQAEPFLSHLRPQTRGPNAAGGTFHSPVGLHGLCSTRPLLRACSPHRKLRCQREKCSASQKKVDHWAFSRWGSREPVSAAVAWFTNFSRDPKCLRWKRSAAVSRCQGDGSN